MRLNARNAPELRISRDYREMLEHHKAAKDKATRSDKEAVTFIFEFCELFIHDINN
jgi:hypothetical protein